MSVYRVQMFKILDNIIENVPVNYVFKGQMYSENCITN